jgi:sodium-dependent dicarboxylate transporter 2/3/5
LLGIAYSASIGGVATLIGTPPNAILAGMLEQQTGINIGFFDWMLFALPLALIFLFIAWLYLNHMMKEALNEINNNAEKILQQELKKLSPLTQEEKLVMGVFSIVCFFWIARGFIDIELFRNIKDSTIGILGAILLYILPAKNGTQRLMNWQTTKNLPWEILILFGGGFALAAGFEHTELTQWLASKFSFLEGANIILIILTITLFVIFLTEITSNTATATLLIPLMIALSQTLEISPLLLATAVAISSSYAFMLPVATPPNAIVFSSGRIPIQKMAKTGFWLNIIGSLLITAFILILIPYIFI